jgi:S1-C subfamily serine protease
MANELVDFSNGLAGLVEATARGIVGVNGRRGMGTSGIVWKDGLILTSAEGIRTEDGIRVLLPNGAAVPAQLRGRDAGTDLAVLQIDATHSNGLQPLEFAADNQLRTGQLAVAVGRTLNTGPIAAFGVVSGVAGEWKTWRGGAIDPFVRLNVPVYSTQSGGAVVDAEGKVIGVVSTGLSRSSTFAITAKTIERIAGGLHAHGHVSRSFLGVSMQPVNLPPEMQEKLGQKTGTMLLGIEPGGPAAAGGLMLGDVLVAADGRAMPDPEAVGDFLERTPAGQAVALRVLRAGVLQELTVRTGEKPRR